MDIWVMRGIAPMNLVIRCAMSGGLRCTLFAYGKNPILRKGAIVLHLSVLKSSQLAKAQWGERLNIINGSVHNGY